MIEVNRALGRVVISKEAVMDLALLIASDSYGVEAAFPFKRPVNFIKGVMRISPKDAIETADDSKISLDLGLSIKEGINPSEVAKSLADRISFELKKSFNIEKSEINIHVRSIKKGRS